MKNDNDTPQAREISINQGMSLHLKSTLAELPLFNAQKDSSAILSDIIKLFTKNPSLPGIITVSGGRFGGFISRRKLFEHISKKYSLEIFSHRPVSLFIDSINDYSYLTLPSSMAIVEAVPLLLERPKDSFQEPILVESENGDYRILDTYQLIIAHSKINTLALNALNEAMEFKTDMLNMAAHDLKNPLGTINNLSKLTLAFLDRKEGDIYEMLTQIRQLAEHMQELVMELLNSTVIESGKMLLKKQVIDFGELVNALVYQSKPAAENKNQAINTSIASKEPLYVIGDMIKLREACDNLISNAIKYSPLEGVIEIMLDSNGSMAVFSVKDQGPGLSQQDKEKLFCKFQRLSAQPTNGESSTGLGLFIAKQIVDLHEGRIVVESEPGKGARFSIEIPITVPEPELTE